MEEEKGYWWCSECKEEVDCKGVTFQEIHDACGHGLEWIKPKAASLIESLRAAIELDEKRRAALENVVEKSRLVFGWDQTHAASFFDKPTAKLQIALKELDALTPTPKEKD